VQSHFVRTTFFAVDEITSYIAFVNDQPINAAKPIMQFYRTGIVISAYHYDARRQSTIRNLRKIK